MSKELGPLDEVSVSARIDESGLSASTKSRAITAFDRLVGSLVDIAGVPVEGLRNRMRAREEIRADLIKVEGELAKRKLAAATNAGDELVDIFLEREGRKQLNREAVFDATLLALEYASPDTKNSDDAAPDFDADWLNIFSRFAEDASSDRMRETWGRVLSGEILSPGKYSLATLQFLSTLDRETAQDFENVLGGVFATDAIFHPEPLEGPEFVKLLGLEERGLLKHGLMKFFSTREDGFAYVDVSGGYLRIKGPANHRIQVSCAVLTRVGSEVRGLVLKAEDMTGAERLLELIKRDAQVSEVAFTRPLKADPSRLEAPRVLWSRENG